MSKHFIIIIMKLRLCFFEPVATENYSVQYGGDIGTVLKIGKIDPHSRGVVPKKEVGDA